MENQAKTSAIWNEVYATFEKNKPLGIQYPTEALVKFVANLRKNDDVKDYFNDKDNEFSSKNFYSGNALEIGFGSIANLKMVNEKGFTCQGLEVSKEAVERGSYFLKELSKDDKIKLALWEPYKIPFANDTYDLIYGLQCIYYNLELEDFIAEVHRTLKPGGSFIFSFFSSNHGYMKYIERVDEKTYKWAANHPNQRLIDAVFRQPQTKEELAALFADFKEVKVFTTESDQTPIFESWWYVCGKK